MFTMKKILIAVVVALVAMASANAQVAPGLKYKDLKGMYNPKEYVPQSIDPYKKGWSGLISFFTPGLGQIMAGEVGRGFIFVGAEAITYTIWRSAVDELMELAVTDANGTVTGFSDEKAAGKHIGWFFGGLAANLAVCIWSSVDAVKVVKVKNMYYQDMYGARASLNVGLEPYFSFTPSPATPSGSSLTPTAGMSLRVSF